MILSSHLLHTTDLHHSRSLERQDTRLLMGNTKSLTYFEEQLRMCEFPGSLHVIILDIVKILLLYLHTSDIFLCSFMSIYYLYHCVVISV